MMNDGDTAPLSTAPLTTVRTVQDLRAAIRNLRQTHPRIALVPTMGALHAGHLTLVKEGLARADAVVATIFVNPKQFGPNEDFSRYPRQEAADRQALASAGCALLFAPPPDVVYPQGFRTSVSVAGLSDPLEGMIRPGHFDGVATVVAKLLLMAGPDVALFGEKDWQQLAIIRRLVTDLDIPVDIVGVPTVRDADGLALSSRNAYLTAEQRAIARSLPESLFEAARRLSAGAPVGPTLAYARANVLAAGFQSVDYLVLADPATLEPLPTLDRPARLLAAARLGTTRLLDNLEVLPA